MVTPGYLGAMGIRLHEGRDFTWRDSAAAEKVLIINETAARIHWPGESPIGHLARGPGRGDSRVIGVVADVRGNSLPDARLRRASFQRRKRGGGIGGVYRDFRYSSRSAFSASVSPSFMKLL
jgi:hypothetical protein